MKYILEPGDHLNLTLNIELDVSRKLIFTDKELTDEIKHYLKLKQDFLEYFIGDEDEQ